MRILRFLIAVLVWLGTCSQVFSQAALTGRIWAPRDPECIKQLAVGDGVPENYFAPGRGGVGENVLAMTKILCVASLDGSGNQALVHRNWETAPSGWYRLAGLPGNYTAVFSNPAHFMRPVVLTNLRLFAGETIDRKIVPRFDYAVFRDKAFDDGKDRAAGYYQTFVARGTSVTHVGFKLPSDGVDGPGPASQTLLVSVHRRGESTPDTWPQVGPAMPVLEVDAGFDAKHSTFKDYEWSAGWNSGEVVIQPGETYAVHLRAKTPGNSFRPYWRLDEDRREDCYRVGQDGRGAWTGRDLWMSVAGDGDGLLIPYNKRVRRLIGKYHELTRSAKRWSQVYVAQGRGLASVMLYVGVGMGNPPAFGRQDWYLGRQRVTVRLRRGGPDGPVVGIEKIASGLSDASPWSGILGVAFAPGEAPVEPGQAYALEFESFGSDREFNPYRKEARDSYEKGAAYFDGKQAMDYDLDMQVVEYEFAGLDWSRAMDKINLLKPGAAGPAKTLPAGGWRTFTSSPGTVLECVKAQSGAAGPVLRVTGTADLAGKPVEGGFVQRIDGLTRLDTYRVSGQVRSSFAVDDNHWCQIGYDLTGQDEDPKAGTIVWKLLPGVHGEFVPNAGDPVRPAGQSISVWLRGRAKSFNPGLAFQAEFVDFELRRVRTDVPARD